MPKRKKKEKKERKSLQGRKNAYICQECKKIVVTVDRDEGVTPFSILCRATEDCEGWMTSAFYDEQVQPWEPTYEWRSTDQGALAPMELHRIGED